MSQTFEAECSENTATRLAGRFELLIFDLTSWPKIFFSNKKIDKKFNECELISTKIILVLMFEPEASWHCTELAHSVFLFLIAATKISGVVLQKKDRAVDIYFLSLCVCTGHLISKWQKFSICCCGRCYRVNWTVSGREINDMTDGFS